MLETFLLSVGVKKNDSKFRVLQVVQNFYLDCGFFSQYFLLLFQRNC